MIMNRSVALVLLALLSACAMPPSGYRDGAVPISATTRFDQAKFAGRWHVIAAYPTTLFPACAGQVWDVARTRLQVRCDVVGPAALDAPLVTHPRGVLRARTADLDRADRALWVMWLDEDRQLAAIGTPSGEMGWVLHRSPALRDDRFNAARQVFDFNGYDVAELKRGTP